MRSISTLLYICIIVAIGVEPGRAGVGDPPTVCCASTATPACDPAGLTIFEEVVLGLVQTFNGDTFAQYLVKAGCWCQNNGAGPESPTWLTCPGLLGAAIVTAYHAQSAAGITNCHCNCPTQTGPALPCPPPPTAP